MILRRSLLRPCLNTSILVRPACANPSLRGRPRNSALQPPQRNYSTPATNDDKPYYITSPIFYVNAAPHVGHLYSMLIPDILKRWQLLQGNKALYSTGTDEHGMKIQRAAEKAGSDPKTFCDREAEVFKNLAFRAEILNDHFIRTTDQEHKEAVQYAWEILQAQGHIYMSKHEGWYSVDDETFYPSSAVHLIVEPSTGRKIMASVETGKEVEWTSEVNYKFRLSAFKDRLLNYYENNPDFIVPRTRMNNVIRNVSEGLEDLSISRPSSRLRWGIPVPTDDSQTIYVWLDALINYITKAGYPWAPGKEQAGGWPADCHVIGKEIVRFHCIYWPAFLMALDLPLPRQILTHGHWTLGRRKMSKSTGNVVNPFFALDRFGPDVMRYYLAHDGDIIDDSDYDNERIIARYKKNLQGGLGNLVTRIVRGKPWSVREAVKQGTAGLLMATDSLGEEQEALIRRLPSVFAENMNKLYVGLAVKRVTDATFRTNEFLSLKEPWKVVEENGGQTDAQVNNVIYVCAEACRVSGILLQPYMPKKMAHLLDMLGVDPDRRTFAFAEFGADDSYGVSMVDVGRGHKGALFPPLTSDF